MEPVNDIHTPTVFDKRHQVRGMEHNVSLELDRKVHGGVGVIADGFGACNLEVMKRVKNRDQEESVIRTTIQNENVIRIHA